MAGWARASDLEEPEHLQMLNIFKRRDGEADLFHGNRKEALKRIPHSIQSAFPEGYPL